MLIFLSMLESDEERRLFNGAKMQFIIDGFLEGNELQKMAASVLQVD